MKKLVKRLGAAALVLVMSLSVFVTADLSAVSAAKTNKTVKTQAQLDTALNDAVVKKIVIKGATEQILMIASGNHTDKELVVKAINTTLINNASFKSVTLKKVDEYSEYSKGNTITVAAKTATVNITKKSKESVITLNKADANVDLDVKGTVNKIVVNKDTNLNITGKKSNQLTLEVKAGAENTKVTSDLKVVADKDIDINGSKEAVKEPEKTEPEKTEEKKDETPVYTGPPANDVKCELSKNKFETLAANEIDLSIQLVDKDSKVVNGHITSSNVKVSVSNVEAASGAIPANTLALYRTAINSAISTVYIGTVSGDEVLHYGLTLKPFGNVDPLNVTINVNITDPKTSADYPNGRTFVKNATITVPATIDPDPANRMQCAFDNFEMEANDTTNNLNVDFYNAYSLPVRDHISQGSISVTINNITVSGTTDAAKIEKIKTDIKNSFVLGTENRNNNIDSFSIPVRFSGLTLEHPATVEFKVSCTDPKVSTAFPNGKRFEQIGKLTLKPITPPEQVTAAKMVFDSGTGETSGNKLNVAVKFVDKEGNVLDRTQTSAKVTVFGVPDSFSDEVITAIKKAITVTELTKTGGVHYFEVSVGDPDFSKITNISDYAAVFARGYSVALKVEGRDATTNSTYKNGYDFPVQYVTIKVMP